MSSPSPGPTVAVVGGGASGTLACLHLLAELRRTNARGEVVLLDRDGRHARGHAYATADDRHLLNAPAARMSAYAADPGHFARWAARHVPGGGDFLPRRAYGDYLAGTLLEAEQAAWPHVRVRRLDDTVTSLRPPAAGRRARLGLAGGAELAADAVVLATGNPAPAALPGLPADLPYVADPWAPGALESLEAMPGDRPARVLVVGTGLTMLDVALTLTARPGTQVWAVSRTGLLPRPHAPGPAGPAALSLPERPAGLGEILRAVRLAVDAAGGEWRPVVDALRPHVPALWAGLPADDQHRFLALLGRAWEVHRHRVPPATAARVEALRAAGRLRVHRGRLAGVAPVRGPHPWCATLAHEGTAYAVGVDAVVNATGAGGATGDPLLSRLFAAGLARPDHLGLGVDAMPDGALRDGAGAVQPWLSALGPPLRGMRWETTAIPEIRDQAAGLAFRLARLAGPAHAAVTIARVGASA